ncbi:MAG TPA: hypothetical protein VM840_08590 [Actinomycetota bacterium]|nr:hypothetical protein [Actinomycetota bacterium]
MRKRTLVVMAAAAGSALAVWALVHRRGAAPAPSGLQIGQGEPRAPHPGRVESSITQTSSRLDPAIDRGAGWIRGYLSRLLQDPPAGLDAEVRRNNGAPGVRLTREGRRVMECWAYDEYIRATLFHPSDAARRQIPQLPNVEVREAAKSGYLSIYVRGPQGLAALGWLILECAAGNV